MNHMGYYGKTVHRGDFVRFNLPKTFITVWDDWLQQVMSEGKGKHADNWDERYVDGPGYRFVLSTGIAGKDAWAGVLIPSIDKVGRCFPLCLTFALPSTSTPASALLSHADWFDAIDDVADHVNDTDYDFACLKDELVTLSNQAVSPSAAPVQWVPGLTRQDGQIQVLVGRDVPLNSVAGATALLDAVLSESIYQYSIWVSRQPNQHAATYITGGLPFGLAGVALFDGDWPATGCASLRTSVAISQAAVIDPESDTGAAANGNTSADEAEADTRAIVDRGEDQTSESAPLNDHKALVPTVEPLELDDDADLEDPWES